MIDVKKEGVLLEKTSLPFENEGVLNPGTIREGNSVHMFYRAVKNGNFSSIGYCRFNGPLTLEFRSDTPVISSELDYESHGVEDPRIVKINDLYYMTYTAYDGINALGALAVSTDLVTWEKKGIIVPQMTYDEFAQLSGKNEELNQKYVRFNQHEGIHEIDGKEVLVWDKNFIFFPRRINGDLHFLHRIKPDIQIVVAVTSLEDLTEDFWKRYFLHLEDRIVLGPKYKHEVSYVGGGCPPIETEYGWLLIYHGVYDSLKGYIYTACAALLELGNPQREIARLPYPLFKPELGYELRGEVNNVCFPTGTAVFEDTLYIYYGAADEQIACASVSMSMLLKELMLNSTLHEK